MKDRNDVLYGLVCCASCTDDDPFAGCKDCPYNGVSVSVQDCRAVLSKDAVELFKDGDTAPNLNKVIKGLEYCMGGCQVSCFQCPYRELGQQPPDSLDNCWILNDVLKLLKKYETKMYTAKELLSMSGEEKYDPVYLVTRDGEFECWMMYQGYLKSKGLLLYREPNGKIIDFITNEYGKTWVCFTERIPEESIERIPWNEQTQSDQ